ncbi:MAG: hypothetical protein ACLQVD_13495 [Capsulimonadaceae bacterium]
MTGSSHRRHPGGNLEEPDQFREMCEKLGAALAKRRHELLLLSDDDRHADPSVLKGYAKEAGGLSLTQPLRVLVSYGSESDPENRSAIKFPEDRQHQHVLVTDVDIAGEYPFNRVSALRRVDAIIVVGGKAGAKQLVEIAEALALPVVPVAAFGGVAESALDRRRIMFEQSVGSSVDCLTRFFGDVTDHRADEIVGIAEALFAPTHAHQVQNRSRHPHGRRRGV